MLERTLSYFALVATFAVAAPSAAQPAPSDERAAAEQRAIEERQLSQQAAEERREIQERQRQLAREAAEDNEQLQRELARAREQLSVTAAEIARLSAQMTQPARDALVNVRYIGAGRAVLGLNIEDTDLGVLVTGVTPNGPAAAAGVTVGDTIVAINDAELARTNDRAPSAALYAQVGNLTPGDQVKLRVLRGGDYRDVVVEAAENQFWRSFSYDGGRVSWPSDWAPFRQSRAWSDLELATLTPALGEYFGVEEGLLVVRAGRAAELGFRDGDVILELGGREPQSPEHALRIMASFEPGESLQASIMRQRRRETLTIRVPAPAESQW